MGEDMDHKTIRQIAKHFHFITNISHASNANKSSKCMWQSKQICHRH